MNIHDVNSYLEKIANPSSKTGQDSVKSSMQHLIFNLSAEQIKWLIRIILKDLKIGIKETFVLGLFHDDALHNFYVTSSLEKACETLNGSPKRLDALIMVPCRPMFCKYFKMFYLSE